MRPSAGGGRIAISLAPDRGDGAGSGLIPGTGAATSSIRESRRQEREPDEKTKMMSAISMAASWLRRYY